MNRILAVVLVAAFALVCAFANEEEQYRTYDFEQYVNDYGKQYSETEFAMRKAIFERELEKIRAHNVDETKAWKLGVNQFTDYTSEELKALRGYKKHPLQPATFDLPMTTALPDQVDWRQKGVVTPVKNQAACGSCWAFATAETLESHWALKSGKLTVLSEQQILDCTPNPDHCGGTGGCGGGTPEIGYEAIIKAGGLASEASYPYTSGGGRDYTCKNPLPTPVAKVSNYTVLPSNKYDPVMNALATLGPLAIAVDASAWGAYRSGVFDGCSKTSPDLDHAVVLVGYGTDPTHGDYWLVRNSWGSTWGEAGYIRLKRSATVDCGTDRHPQDGTGCNGGPATVTVCGTCGLLYDVVYPIVAA